MYTMKKTLGMAFFACAFSLSLQAQFMRTYSNTPDQGVRFAALVPVVEGDPETNLYVAGSNEGYLLIGEIEQDGDFVWTRRVNAKDTSLIINQMIKDSEGNLVMVGTAVAGELGKAFILKFSPATQTVLWFRRCTSNTFFWDVAEMGPGGDYLVGGQETYNGSGVGTDDLTIKFKRVSGASNIITNLNKHLNESVEAVVYDDSAGVFYSTGRYELASGISKFRICINRVQLDGTVDWTRGYVKNTASSGRFYSEDMIRDGENLVVVGAGDDGGTNSLRYLWFIKTDLNGEAIVTKKLDVVGASYDGLIASVRPYAGGYIMYGSLHNGSRFTDAFLISTDTEGNVNWSKSYPFRLRTPTTGLYCSSAMTVVGDNVFVVGEKLNDINELEGVLVKVPAISGELSTCDADFVISPISMTNFDDYYTLDTASLTLSFPNSFPGVKPLSLSYEQTCNPNGIVTDGEEGLGRFAIGDVPVIGIYPNPTSEFVRLNVADQTYFTSFYKVIDMHGQVVFEGVFRDGDAIVDVSQWPSGLYIVQIENLGKSVATFIKD